MALDPTINFGKVTVSTGYDDADTSIVLSSGHGANLPSTFSYNLVWWNSTDYDDPADDPNVEIVRCTNRSTDTLTVTRAQEGTAASTKNTGGKTYKMALCFTKKMKDDIASGRWEKIETHTASSDATIDFTSGISSDYDTYMIIMEDILPATDNSILNMRMSTSSTFNAGASDYSWAQISGVVPTSESGTGDNADSKMQISGSAIGTGGNESMNGVLIIHNLAKAIKTWFTGTTIVLNSTPNTASSVTGGRYLTAEANDGIRFLMSSGNIASGTFTLYGLKV